MIFALATPVMAATGNNGNGNGNNGNNGNGNGNKLPPVNPTTQTLILKGGGADFKTSQWQPPLYPSGYDSDNVGQNPNVWRLVYTGKDTSAISTMTLTFINSDGVINTYDWTPGLGFSTNNGGNNPCWIIVAPYDWGTIDCANSTLDTDEPGNLNFNVGGFHAGGPDQTPPAPEPVTYQISFYANDGTGKCQTADMSGFNGLIACPSDPVRGGYEFTGWFTQNNLQVTNGMKYSDLVSGDTIISVDVYAQWAPVAPTTIPATDITPGKDTLNLNVGDTYPLTYTLEPTNSTDAVTWASSDESVATVASDGTVTAIGSGIATITATTTSGEYAEVTVNVTDTVSQTLYFDPTTGKFYLDYSNYVYSIEYNGQSGNWSWDDSTNTLSLTDFSWVTSASTALDIENATYDDMTINVSGTNTFTAGDSSANESAGVLVRYKATINGDGVLNATGGNAYYYSYGLQDCTSSLTIDGCTVYATSKTANSESDAISCGGSLNMVSGTLTATAGDETSGYGTSAGISTGNNFQITGGQVTATAGSASVNGGSSYGIRAGSSVIIYDGEVNATAGSAQNSYGVYCGESYYTDTFAMSGGTVNATAGTAANDSCGIYCKGTDADNNLFALGGGTVNATGGDSTSGSSYGIYAAAALTVQDGAYVTATAGTATSGGSYGIWANTRQVSVDDSTVNAAAGAAAGDSYGIRCSGALFMDNNSTVNATAGSTGSYYTGSGNGSYGVEAANGVRITSGLLTAQGDTGAIYFDPHYAESLMLPDAYTYWTDPNGDGTAVPGGDSFDTNSNYGFVKIQA